LFAEPAECAVPGIDVELIGIDQGTVNVEDESEHGDKGELRKSIEQAHVLELNRLSVRKCADPPRNLSLYEFDDFEFCTRSSREIVLSVETRLV
jgi:hypothetical protein